jgi:hypothetical protein
MGVFHEHDDGGDQDHNGQRPHEHLVPPGRTAAYSSFPTPFHEMEEAAATAALAAVSAVHSAMVALREAHLAT